MCVRPALYFFWSMYISMTIQCDLIRLVVRFRFYLLIHDSRRFVLCASLPTYYSCTYNTHTHRHTYPCPLPINTLQTHTNLIDAERTFITYTCTTQPVSPTISIHRISSDDSLQVLYCHGENDAERQKSR